MRTVHYRVWGVPRERLEELEQAVTEMANRRSWQGDRFTLSTERSRALFEMEFFRHARDEEGDSLVGAGFVRLKRDETDALATLFFLQQLSARFDCRAAYRDPGHALAKMRHLEFRAGNLVSGRQLDRLIGTRPIVKRVGQVAVTFYPPLYRRTTRAEEPAHEGWTYAVHGMRADAPTFLEAEAEAMKLITGFRRLQ